MKVLYFIELLFMRKHFIIVKDLRALQDGWVEFGPCLPCCGILNAFLGFQKLTCAFQVNLTLTRVKYIIDFSVSQDPNCLAGMHITYIEKN